MTNLLWIAAGGALGAMARYGLTQGIQKWLGPGFAWGTVSVNLLGCFLIGLAFHAISSVGNLQHEIRFLGVVGFLGAFTTFSTFSLETINFLRDGQFTVAAGYVLISNLVGVGLCFAGLRTGHWLLSKG
ncbi:MAG: fluoride efflux transporter CrcB [Acidobacteria bacterium]|nr:fluoride efflux transporter CrcB [Acidobacteriota bacterium]